MAITFPVHADQEDIISLSVEDVQKLDEVQKTQGLIPVETSPDSMALSRSFLDLQNLLSPEELQEPSLRQVRSSISTNPADLEPFRDTTWEFAYTIIDTFTDTIFFADSVSVSKDGSVLLLGTNKNGSAAAIGYSPDSGKYLIIVKSALESAYLITLEGCCNVQGQYYATWADSDFKRPYPLTGVRITGPSTESTSTESAENSLSIVMTDVPEPTSWQTQIDYYRNDETGDVWGITPAWQLPAPSNELPQDVWKYGLRAIYLAKYACQSAEVRDWMPINIANGVYYCTNPEDKQQTVAYLKTLANRLREENNTRTASLRAGNQMLVFDSEPTMEQAPIDYYRDAITGDVWGTEPAYRFSTPANLPEDLHLYGLRALYLAKYACQSAEVRDWMPTNIANGIYYCTNPEDREQTINYLLALVDKLESTVD